MPHDGLPTVTRTVGIGNRLLATLPPADIALLAPELELCQHRAEVGLERVPEHGAAVESGAKSGGGNPRSGPCRVDDGGNGRR